MKNILLTIFTLIMQFSIAHCQFFDDMSLSINLQRSDLFDPNSQRDATDYYADMKPVHGFDIGLSKEIIQFSEFIILVNLNSSLQGFNAQNVFDYKVIEEIQGEPKYYYLQSNEDKNHLLFAGFSIGAKRNFDDFSISIHSRIQFLISDWIDREVWRYIIQSYLKMRKFRR